jgi:hypothetical protein
MYKIAGAWHSEFPRVQGVPEPLFANNAVVAAASYQGLTGGHAALYLEQIEPSGDAVLTKIHLTAGAEGSGTAETAGSGSFASGSTGSLSIDIDIEEKERNVDTPDDDHRGSYLRYQSYVITDASVTSLKFAANRFKFKNNNGRYRYRLGGGAVGWLLTRPGTRGVNCTDFVIKILKEAGIANIKNAIVNAPRRVAR